MFGQLLVKVFTQYDFILPETGMIDSTSMEFNIERTSRDKIVLQKVSATVGTLPAKDKITGRNSSSLIPNPLVSLAPNGQAETFKKGSH
jgi:hypothetical protein